MKKKSNDRETLLQLLYRLIGIRPRSVKEIKDYLQKKQVDQETQVEILAKLIDLKLLDDVEFARWFVDQRQRFRPKGKRALQSELATKGISTENIAEVLESNFEEYEAAQKLFQKKVKSWSRYSSEEKKQKIVRLLKSHGFSWSTISQLLKDIHPFD